MSLRSFVNAILEIFSRLPAFDDFCRRPDRL